jgi:hypothetical protein
MWGRSARPFWFSRAPAGPGSWRPPRAEPYIPHICGMLGVNLSPLALVRYRNRRQDESGRFLLPPRPARACPAAACRWRRISATALGRRCPCRTAAPGSRPLAHSGRPGRGTRRRSPAPDRVARPSVVAHRLVEATNRPRQHPTTVPMWSCRSWITSPGLEPLPTSGHNGRRFVVCIAKQEVPLL